MIIRNRLDRSFGPLMAFAGIILFFAGVIMVRHLAGIILLLAGALLATTTDETSIDVPRQRIRSGTQILHLFTLGKWQEVREFAGLTLIPVRKQYAMYSLSNRKNAMDECDFRIFILDKRRKPAFALAKYTNRDEALQVLDNLSLTLHLPVFMQSEK